MNTDLHEYLEPRNTRNNTERVGGFLQCLPCFPWLGMSSALSLQCSEFGEAGWLKEIQL